MNKPTISLIAALSENRVIGNKGEIPWKIPGEQKRFKEITTPHPIIMGRKTYESIGRTLPNRPNIIISRDDSLKIEGGHVAHSLHEAIEKAKELEQQRISSSKEVRSSEGSSLSAQTKNMGGEVFIIGGGKVFEEAIQFADKLYLTIIHKEFEGDAFFPEYSSFTKELSREEKEIGECKFSYIDLIKA